MFPDFVWSGNCNASQLLLNAGFCRLSCGAVEPRLQTVNSFIAALTNPGLSLVR